MIAGESPFAGHSVSETLANLINAEPHRLARLDASVPDELQRIVSKTLRKNKGERYQTMKDVLTDLKGWDKLREETFARQLKLGVVPAGTKLTERPKEIRAWDSLTANQKKVYAHMMEVYAACLAYVDYNIGRVIKAVEDTGEMDNTVIIYIMGDNGASGEGTLQGLANEIGVAANGVDESIPYLLSIMDDLGGPTTYNHYPAGWAHAMDTPFQWTKQVASHFGGTRNGLVISWPKRIKQTGEIRTQFSSVIDIAPTILEAAGVKQPTMINGVTQTPIEGSSLVYAFDDAKAPTRHTTQYFEMFANRGIYQDGWMANTTALAQHRPRL
jgi:arylsulfatase A-like enzyme